MTVHKYSAKWQSGFTIIEIAIAMFLGLLIIGIIVSTFSENQRDIRIGLAKRFLMKDLSDALQFTMIRNTGPIITSNEANDLRDQLWDRGLPKKTPFGGDWGVNQVDRGNSIVKIDYNIPDTEVGNALKNLKTQSNVIVDVVDGNYGLVISINY